MKRGWQAYVDKLELSSSLINDHPCMRCLLAIPKDPALPEAHGCLELLRRKQQLL